MSAESEIALFCAQTTLSLCFGLIFVQGELNPANSIGLNFQKHWEIYTPDSVVLDLRTGKKG